MAFNSIPGKDYPGGKPGDMKYHFFLDLEHGYCLTAGSRIHLYADELGWAIVPEKSSYQNGRMTAEAELNYVGNCLQYSVARYHAGDSSHWKPLERPDISWKNREPGNH